MTNSNDIFYLDKVFPQADKIFSEGFKNVKEIINDALIVLDTNTLLLPFNTKGRSIIDIKEIYLKYKYNNRLFIPARVAREFAQNRGNKIGDVFLQIRQIKSKLDNNSFKIDNYPILEENESYKELVKEFSTISNSLGKSRKYLDNLEALIQGWTWNDALSQAYEEIFTPEIVVEVGKSQEDLKKDLKFRIEHKIAPGYKDSAKIDDGIGDLVIWQTILELSKKSQRDIIFVTNDQKNDWFYKQDKIGLYPKFELFDEFRRYTDGRSISIISFIKFLELSNAEIETITEVKNTIQTNSLADMSAVISDLRGDDISEEKATNYRVRNNAYIKVILKIEGKAGLVDLLIDEIRMDGFDLQAEISTSNFFILKIICPAVKERILREKFLSKLKNYDITQLEAKFEYLGNNIYG